jgi:dUTPase
MKPVPNFAPLVEVIQELDDARYEINSPVGYLSLWTRVANDFYLNKTAKIPVGTTLLVPTGVKVQVPQGYHVDVYPVIPGLIPMDWDSDLSHIAVFNAFSSQNNLAHGDTIAKFRLAKDLSFRLMETLHA